MQTCSSGSVSIFSFWFKIVTISFLHCYRHGQQLIGRRGLLAGTRVQRPLKSLDAVLGVLTLTLAAGVVGRGSVRATVSNFKVCE